MNPIFLFLSLLYGLMPFNHVKPNSSIFLDYSIIVAVPIFYLTCYGLVNLAEYGVYALPMCDSICRLGNTLFVHLGCFLYLSIFFLVILRRKTFFIRFHKSLQEIDVLIEKCKAKNDDKPAVTQSSHLYTFTWVLMIGMFGYALFHDVSQMLQHYKEYFFINSMVNTFPFFAGSIVQGQFIYYVSVISDRFSKINNILEKINKECDKKNAPIEVFDIESNTKKQDKKTTGSVIIAEVPNEKDALETDSSDDEDDDDENIGTCASDGQTSEASLPDLFKLHDKILTLSVLTNSEFGPQCVPYMAACFVVSIFGIFLETKVLFIVGGKSQLLDYVTLLYVIWSLTMIVVAYLVLRLCCNANGYSKQSAMIVHEIMQKKPAFMLGNDLYYNKMKSFTLQFLHWESYFQFNGIGLFALDYTFIFSTVSAATSYLIVLLQFDMTSILKGEGLTK